MEPTQIKIVEVRLRMPADEAQKLYDHLSRRKANGSTEPGVFSASIRSEHIEEVKIY